MGDGVYLCVFQQGDREEVETHDPYFEPLVNLPKIEVKTLEEDEEEFIKR